MKLIFIGTAEFGATILEGLIKSGHKPFLVVSAPDKPVGRKQIITPPPVKVMAEKYHIPVVQPEKIGNWQSEVENLKPDLGIIASYGQILPEDILSIPKYGFINVHPSLLPKYRGASPIRYAILKGDDKTGVTIMRVSEKLDAGPILLQREAAIGQNETFQSLHDRLARLGAELLIEALPKLFAGKLSPLTQDESKATYTKILSREDGKIDWQKPAAEIERQIRALNPWPGTYTFFKKDVIKGLEKKEIRLKILKAKIENNKLIIEEVQMEGKKPMSFQDFLRGNPDFKIPC